MTNIPIHTGKVTRIGVGSNRRPWDQGAGALTTTLLRKVKVRGRTRPDTLTLRIYVIMGAQLRVHHTIPYGVVVGGAPHGGGEVQVPGPGQAQVDQPRVR